MSYQRTIRAYVAEEFLLSTGIAFSFFFFIFFINQLLLLAEDILSKRVPFHEVALLVLYASPAIVALSLPFATVLGVLMTLGKFGSVGELVAFQAGGVSIREIFLVFLVLCCGLAGLSFLSNDVLLPAGTINFTRLYRSLVLRSPQLELDPYQVKRYENTVLVTGRTAGGGFVPVLIIDRDPEGRRRYISARRAEVGGDDERMVSLVLEDVLIQGSSSGDRVSHTSAGLMRYNILLRNITASYREPGPREMSSLDVYRELVKREAAYQERLREHRRLESETRGRLNEEREAGRGVEAEKLKAELDVLDRRRPTDRSLQLYRVEFHKKFALPFSCVPFLLFAFPIGLLQRRGGRTIGFGIGVLVCTAYWALLVAGQTLATRSGFPAELAMWMPNFVLAAAAGVGFFVYRRQ